MIRSSSPWIVAALISLLTGCQAGIISDGAGEGNSDKSDEGAETVRIGNFPGPDGTIRAPYVLRGNTAVVGGDILWPASAAHSINSAVAAGPFNRWPGGIVPYVNSSNSSVFLSGVAAWNAVSSQTGITLVERTNQSDYINVISGDGCYSYMGVVGGAQELSLGAGCYEGAAIHEIGHALGMMHEHMRADRDSYIRFNWDNVVGGETGQIAQVNLGITQGSTNYSEYDFRSIMHYANNVSDPSFVIDPSIPLYEVIESGAPTTVNNNSLSADDISGVAAMYDGYGGEVPNETNPDPGCSVAECAPYGIGEGQCGTLSTGSYSCEDSCLTRVSDCGATDPEPNPTYTCDNGAQIPESYYCDSIVDCSDASDELNCGGTTDPDPSPYGDCNVSSYSGTCIDTSTSICAGQLFTGYCPGGNEIRCCI